MLSMLQAPLPCANSLQCWRDKSHSARLKNQAEVLLWLRDKEAMIV